MSPNGTQYRQGALYMTESTTVDEVIDYLRDCIENPVMVGDTIIWNFSTHELDIGAVLTVDDKNQDRFVVPYQVTGAWAFMFTLLPEEIKNAETLVYKPDVGEYHAYRSLYRTTPQDRHDQIRNDLSRRMLNVSGRVLGLEQ